MKRKEERIPPVTYSDEIKAYASAIHRLTCNGNHTDYCGWGYGEGQREFDYKRTLAKLSELKEFTPEQLHRVADIVRPETIPWRKW